MYAHSESPRSKFTPICPGAPRYAPGLLLPAYRHAPGHTPHPVRHPAGHSFSASESARDQSPPESWRRNKAYLFGVDLYNQGYLWESHEAWEDLWRMAGRHSVEGRFLQSLIFNSAALLKAWLRCWRGAATHSRRAVHQLKAVRDMLSGEQIFMGVDVPVWTERLTAYYEPLWTGTAPDEMVLRGTPPCLRLHDSG